MSFLAREIGSDDSWHSFDAADAEEAAENCAEKIYDEACDFEADEIDIEVRDSSGETTRWAVAIEFTPTFSAGRAPEASS